MDYVCFGNGKIPMAILPGLSDGLATVKGKALLLAPAWKPFFHDYAIYVFSRRNALPPGYTAEKMAEDQAEAMHILHLEQAVLIGVSQGGMIAQLIAANHPECVRCLVLVVTAPYCNDCARSVLARWRTLASAETHQKLMIDTAEKSYSESRLRSLRKLYPLFGWIAKPKSYARFLTSIAAIETFDARKALPKISCPVLILGGRKDLIVTAEASEELHDLIPKSELFFYEDYGHALYEEAKDFNDRILSFLKKHACG